MTDIRTMRSPAESVMTREDQQNAGGPRVVEPGSGFVHYGQAPLSDYPRMMYKATDKEITQPHAEEIAELKDPPMVINNYGGLLCEIMVAHDESEAEVLASNGWDISPRAAHGIVDGMVAATSAKDEQIAELTRRLAEATANQGSDDTPKRGPGRPPRVREEGIATDI